MSVSIDPEGAELDALHQLADFAKRDVLEVGCGDGRLTFRYAHETRSVQALDADGRRIAVAAERTPESLRSKVTFRTEDVTMADLGEGAFDLALLAHSL